MSGSGRIDDLPPLREVIASHGLAAKKSLGQNFLLDLNLTARIARAAGNLKAADVLEVGADPVFKERLRQKLWRVVSERYGTPAVEGATAPGAG